MTLAIHDLQSLYETVWEFHVSNYMNLKWGSKKMIYNTWFLMETGNVVNSTYDSLHVSYHEII